MFGRAPVLLAVALLAARVAGAAPDGGALWDRRAVPRPAATVALSAGPGAACELARVDRATTTPARCLACHDGSSATGIDVRLSHPVGVEYASAALRHPDRLVAPALLPREVVLVAGKIACTSCHDAASPDPKHVAISARLCESCHPR